MTKAEIMTADKKVPAEVQEGFKVETSAQNMVLPFLKVIQAQSSELVSGSDKYNENVRPGNIYDSITRTVYNDLKIIICGIRNYYGEWEGDVRGTLKKKHRKDSPEVLNAKRIKKTTDTGYQFDELVTASGNKLVDTFGVVCLIKEGDSAIPATFTLSKTALAAGRTLNTLLALYQNNGVPVFKFSVNAKKNNKGSWFLPVFELAEYEQNTNIISMAAGLNKIVDDIIFAFQPEEIVSEKDTAAVNEDVV